MNIHVLKQNYMFYLLSGVTACALGFLVSVNGKPIIAALVGTYILGVLLVKFNMAKLYSLLFICIIWWPVWINSYSMMGLRVSILTINYPLIFLLLFAIKSVHYISKNPHEFKIETIDWFMAAGIIWLLYSAITKSISPESKSSFYLLGFPMLYYFTTRYSTFNKKDVIEWMKKIIFFSVLTVPYMLYEMVTTVNIFLPPTSIYENFVYNYNLENHNVFQPSGPFVDPNTAGMFLPLAVGMALYLFYSSSDAKAKKKYLVYVVILTIGVAITLSRTSYICLIMVFVLNFIFAIRKKTRYILGLTIFLSVAGAYLLIIGVPPALQSRLGDSGTIDQRSGFYEDFVRLVGDNWVTGMGFDNFRFRERITADGGPAHNIFVTILIELGIVGVITFFSPLLFIFLRGKKYLKDPETDRLMVLTCSIIFVSYYLGGLTMNPHVYIQLNCMLYIFMSIFLHHPAIFQLDPLGTVQLKGKTTR